MTQHTVNVQQIERRLERLKHLFLNGDIEAVEYDLERLQLRRQLAQAEPKITTRLNEQRAHLLLADLPALLAGGSFAARRAFLRAVLDQVWLQDRRVVAVTPRVDVYPLVKMLDEASMGDYTSVSLPPAIRSS